LSDFKQTSAFLADIKKILRYQISQKSVHWEQGCYMQTDKYDKGNSHFLQCCKRS